MVEIPCGCNNISSLKEKTNKKGWSIYIAFVYCIAPQNVRFFGPGHRVSATWTPYQSFTSLFVVRQKRF